MRLSDIARASGVSILQLARMVTTPRNLEDLGRVAQLHAIERKMLLGRLKREALMRLRELTDEVSAASGDEVRACEVMRKACVDILRYGHGPASLPHSTPPPRDDMPEPLNEEKILEALERLGREENQYEPDEPRAQASGSSSLSQASRSVELVPWSKAEPQATREGVVGVEATDEVQVGMAFGKTSDHGTESIRTGKMPMPLVEVPSDTHLESCLPNDSRSRSGPGVCGGRASGSLRKCTDKLPGPLLKDADNRTGGAPALRATCRGSEDRNSTSASQTRFDDAHPP